MLTIALASDLHFEFHQQDEYWMPPLAKACDVLVLAGDIGVGQGALEAVLKISKTLPDSDIIWVAGNHEFYRQSIDTQIESYRRACADNPRVHFLENDQIEIKGFRFLGCTLWSGFDSLGLNNRDQALVVAQNSISDFSLIRQDHGAKPFTTHDAKLKFDESYQWLSHQLSLGANEKTIVVTHFPPSLIMGHKKAPENLLTAYFQANCDQLIKKFSPPLWFYGHNHWSDKQTIGKTCVASQQLGYSSENKLIPAYDPDYLFRLD